MLDILLLCILSVYAVSYTLVYKDGPYDVLDRFRSKLEVLNCVPCLSFYLSVVSLFLTDYSVLGWLATWGGVILLDLLITRRVV